MHLATISLLTLSSLLLAAFCQGDIREISQETGEDQPLNIRQERDIVRKQVKFNKNGKKDNKFKVGRTIINAEKGQKKIIGKKPKEKKAGNQKKMLETRKGINTMSHKRTDGKKKIRENENNRNIKGVENAVKVEGVKISQPYKRKTIIRERDDSRSTCTGTSLGDSCLDSLKAAMKYDRDKITTFKNQLERAINFDKIIGKKVEKSEDFSNTTTYMLIALGGNVSSLNCSGNPGKTEEAIESYNTLANCSTSISTSCMIPTFTAPNFTELNICKDFYADVEAKNDACLKMRTSNGTELCECWSKAAGLVVDAKTKTKTGTCDAQQSSKDLLTYKNSCLDAFLDCKKAEDSAVSYIMTCSGSSNLSFNTTDT